MPEPHSQPYSFSHSHSPLAHIFPRLSSHISHLTSLPISPPRLKDLYEGDWAQWTQELNAKGLTLNGDMM